MSASRVEFDPKKSYTIGEQYGPAMEVQTSEEAEAYFAALVRWHAARWPSRSDEAVDVIKQNLGYYAGYYDSATRERVERLFNCAHPVFGAIAEKGKPTAAEALCAGLMAGVAARQKNGGRRAH